MSDCSVHCAHNPFMFAQSVIRSVLEYLALCNFFKAHAFLIMCAKCGVYW